MQIELGFIIKLKDALGDLELELREIYNSHDDIYSNEHVQTRELLKVLRNAKEEVSKIGGNLTTLDEFDL